MNKFLLLLTTLMFAMAQAETLPPFSDLSRSIQPGTTYQHYKGHLYRILAISRHSETLEEHVVYQALYGQNDVWVRPLSLFIDQVNNKPRFTLVP
jgi:hypothetical protein